MDLRSRILELLSPTCIGDELMPGVRLLGASTELGLRLTFSVGGAAIHVEVSLRDEGRAAAAHSERLAFAYRAGPSAAPVAPRVGLALCRAVAARAASREHAVLEGVRLDAAAAGSSLEGTARVREVTIARLLEPAGTPAAPYFTLSPYVGCLIGCRFCYAQARVGSVRRLEGLPPAPWGSYVDVRVNAPEILAQELEALPPYPLKFCPIVSDPYHAVERRFEVTRGCLLAIRDAARPRAALVLTRAKLIERDAALIASIPSGYGGISIPTIDDDVRLHFEARGASIAERLGALDTLRRAGARTFAIVQPLLPGNVLQLADALAARVESVRIDTLHGVENAAEDFTAPAYAEASDPGWQADRALALADALRQRGVAVWTGELPDELVGVAEGPRRTDARPALEPGS